MDFALTEEQQAIFDMARDFGAEHIAPHSRDWERAGTIPKDLWPRIAQLGFGGLGHMALKLGEIEYQPQAMPIWPAVEPPMVMLLIRFSRFVRLELSGMKALSEPGQLLPFIRSLWWAG